MSLDLAGVQIESGQKLQGYLKVGEASTHDVRMPYIVINGRDPGPILCVLGGVHSLECASVEGALRVAREIDPGDLKGVLIVVPIVNVEGFHARTPYHNALDHLNQNRVFPGDPERTMTSRIAHTVFEGFVSKADYLIDLHSGDLGEDATRGVFIWKTENESLHAEMVKMASCFDVQYIESMAIKGSTGEALNMYGIPAIMTESGTPFPLREEDIIFQRDGVINYMKFKGMLDGDSRIASVTIDPPSQRLFSEHGGIWRKWVKAGQRVKKGTVLGEIANLFGETLQTVTAPFDGVANVIKTYYEVNTGDTLLYLVKT
jgi:predicted deacylase